MEKYDKNDWIYIKGYKPHKFYIIISGKVGILDQEEPSLEE